MVRFSLVIFHLFYGFILALYILYISDKSKKKLIKSWSKKLIKLFKVKLEINQNIHRILSEKNYLIVSNHISWLDIFLINSVYPVPFLSKADVAKWPLIGKLTKSADTIYINRDKNKSLSIASNLIENHLKKMNSVYFFPESVATDGSKLLPFKSNFFQTAINANVDVLPIVIKYTEQNNLSTAPSYAGDISLMQSMMSLIRLKNIKAKLSILPKIPSNVNRKMLAEKTHKKIYEALK